MKNYTGWIDSKGEKIYVGDIIKYCGDDDYGSLFIARFNKGEYYYESQEDFEYNSFMDMSPVEKIGNEFDNPELLQEVK